MYTCYGCHRSFNFPRILVNHMKLTCKALAGSSGFHCGQRGCFRKFTTTNSLSKHLRKYHTTEIISPCTGNESQGSVTGSFSADLPLPSSSVGFDTKNYSEIGLIPPAVMEQHFAVFLSSLYSKPGVSRIVVQHVAQELNKLLHSSKESIIKSIYHSFEAEGIDVPANMKSRIESGIENYTQSLSSLTTEYKRFQFFKNIGTLIYPEEITIGQRNEFRHSTTGLSFAQVPCCMQIVPLGEVLKSFLSIKGVMKEVLDHVQNLKNSKTCIENISQGKVWRDINAAEGISDDITLPLVLFYDDFEICNPLGSRASVHKLGGVYVSLPFLPPQYYSQLKHIFFFALFHASDRSNFGNNMIFQKVIDVLNVLSNTGVHLNTDAYTGIIKFRVACITGDNLGLNSILGFVENFVANYCCRICNVNKQQLQTLHLEDRTLMRSAETYEQQLLLKEPSKTGIKERCVFLDNLCGFKLFEHIAVDILHDYLEGCCRYVMSFVVNFLVMDSKLVPLNILQSKLNAFDYGPDSGSKPSNCIVVEGTNLKLKISAAEMQTLVRYFGLLVGYYVPEDHNVWIMYINLRKIMDRLINPRVTEESAEQLRYMIAELNYNYSYLTKSTLKPKFHFLIHYPDMLLKFGPLTQISTMRFEARHRVSKEAARASSSKVNICKTVAIKNQLLLNDMLIKNEGLRSIIYGKKKKVHSDILHLVQGRFNKQITNLHSVNWLKIKGFKLDISSVLTVDLCLETLLPVFAAVTGIYISDHDQVFISCTKFKTMYYDLHYFAYNVRRTSDSVCFQSKDFLSLVPNTLTIMENLQIYVTVRMPFD